MLSIVIVNWNAGRQLTDCLKSIRAFGHSVSSVIVVDNASNDESLIGIEMLDLPIKIIRNADNRGFGAACNQGASVATGDYLLFLNPDVRLFKQSLSVPLAFMKQSENISVGICGIQLLDESEHVVRSCARFPSLGIFVTQALGLNKLPWLRSCGMHMSEWDHSTTREVEHVIGAFYFMRRSLFESLGGFDERFFVYLEDLDFSLRARRAGWRIVYLAEAQAFHAGGGISSQVKARRLFYSLRSKLLYAFKHFRFWEAWVFLVVTLMLEPVSRFMFSLFWGGVSDARNTLKAYGMLYRDLLSIIEKAR